MPLQSRVTPFGKIVAVTERGTLKGNRGVLHDDAGHIVRSWQVRRWIACRTRTPNSSSSTRRRRSPPDIGPAPSVAMPTINASRKPGRWEWELQMALMKWMRCCMPIGWRSAARTSASAPIGSSWPSSQTALSFVSLGRPGSYGMASCWSGLQVGIGGDSRLYLPRVLSKS